MRPPYETFTKPTCKGSIALGTACGHCEKCEWERAQGVTRAEQPEPLTITQARGPAATAGEQDGRVRMRLYDDAAGEVIVWLTPGQASTLAGHLALAAGDAIRNVFR